ncbi:MAG: helix-turn-helix transcriptional regulator [Bdellovibrionota bacterium]
MLITQIADLAKQYGLTRLSEESGISRPHLHRILSGKNSPSLDTLLSVLDILGCSIELKFGTHQALDLARNDHLTLALAHYGAPLFVQESTIAKHKSCRIPPLGEVAFQALLNGRSNASINTVLPVFLHKNLQELNLDKIIENFDDHQYLGYLLDILYRLTSERKYILAISKLNIDPSHIRTKKLIKGSPNNNFQKDFFKKVDNPAANTWKFQTSDSLESVKLRFNKWNNFDLH